MKIVYGTGNKEKLLQMEKIIKVNDFDVELFSLKDINFNEEIIEDGETFEENSKIKATALRNYCNKNNFNECIILTDDSGLCVDALNGAPGVYSARYAGDHAPQDVTLNKLMDNLKDFKGAEKRKASFTCVLTASLPDGTYIVSKGETHGHIKEQIGKLGGLTYEPVFVPEGFDKPISEMSIEEFKKLRNHRVIAMTEIFKKLKEII